MLRPRTVLVVSLTFLCLASGVTTLICAQPAAATGVLAKRRIAEQRLVAVKKVYDILFESVRNGGSAPGHEEAYLWSRRWLEAELDLADSANSRRLAYQLHLDRMKEQEERYRKLDPAAKVLRLKLAAAESFRLEAELWVEQHQDAK